MTIEGTSGNDVLYGIDQEGYTPESISGAGGNDLIYAGGGMDFVYGDAGDDEIYGEAGDDILDGDNIVDIGNDYIDGGAGNDEVMGGGGRDILIGGTGNDLLIGGRGSDFFVFNNLFNGGIDTISDFKIARDYIVVDLNSVGFGNTGLAPNATITADQFRQGTTALDASDRFIYDNSTGHLFFDPDGTGGAPQIQLATLDWMPSISHNHIYAYQDRLPTQQMPGNASNSPTLLHGQWTTTVGNIQYYNPTTGQILGSRGGVISYTFNPNGTYIVDTINIDPIVGNFHNSTIGRYTLNANGVITLNPVQETLKGTSGGAPFNRVKTTGLATEQLFWVQGEGARGKYILLDDAIQVNGIYQPKDPESEPTTYELTGGSRNITLPGGQSTGNPGQGNSSNQGTPGNDTLTGTAQNDRLLGFDGDDLLKGGKGKDRLFGGAGNDKIWGGGESDILKGDRGRDIFALEKGAGRDVIKDFRDRQDKLGLTPGIRLRDLRLTQQGNSVLVSAGNDPLAVLSGVRINQITVADFVQMGGF